MIRLKYGKLRKFFPVNSSYVYPYGTLVVSGEKITFAGHGFGTSKDAVTVTFDGSNSTG